MTFTAAGGNVANLPHSFAAVATAQGANAAPTWDTFKSGSNVYDKDGQAMDQLLAGPSLLLDMGRNSQAVIDAVATDKGIVFAGTASGEVLGHLHLNTDKRYQGQLHRPAA